jgi:hypothetical protein
MHPLTLILLPLAVFDCRLRTYNWLTTRKLKNLPFTVAKAKPLIKRPVRFCRQTLPKTIQEMQLSVLPCSRTYWVVRNILNFGFSGWMTSNTETGKQAH